MGPYAHYIVIISSDRATFYLFNGECHTWHTRWRRRSACGILYWPPPTTRGRFLHWCSESWRVTTPGSVRKWCREGNFILRRLWSIPAMIVTHHQGLSRDRGMRVPKGEVPPLHPTSIPGSPVETWSLVAGCDNWCFINPSLRTE